MEEKKYKVGLLDEITRWGIDILASCHNVPTYEKLLNVPNGEMFRFGAVRDVVARYDNMMIKAKYFDNNDLNKRIRECFDLIILYSNLLLDMCKGKKEVRITELEDYDKKTIINIFGEKKRVMNTIEISTNTSMKLQMKVSEFLSITNNLSILTLKA